MDCEFAVWNRKEGLDVEVRLLGSPCHAGHTAGCHHGTFSSLLWLCVCRCCSIQLCGHTAPSCPISSVALIGSSARFFSGTAGRAPDGHGARRGEGRQTGPLWLSFVTGNGAPRTRRGETGGASRSFRVICLLFLCCDWSLLYLIRGEGEISQARRSFVRRPDFWSFNLANWPPRQTDSQTASPPLLSRLLLALFGRTLRHHSLFLDSCLIYFFLNTVLISPCVTSIHPLPWCPLSHWRVFFS